MWKAYRSWIKFFKKWSPATGSSELSMTLDPMGIIGGGMFTLRQSNMALTSVPGTLVDNSEKTWSSIIDHVHYRSWIDL
jgi:hypothetical protein